MQTNSHTNGKLINYKLDTGSDVNILSIQDFKALKRRPRMHKTHTKLSSYSGDNMPAQSTCVLDMMHKGENYKPHFVIAEKDAIPILGNKALDKLGLIQRIFTIDICQENGIVSFQAPITTIFC